MSNVNSATSDYSVRRFNILCVFWHSTRISIIKNACKYVAWLFFFCLHFVFVRCSNFWHCSPIFVGFRIKCCCQKSVGLLYALVLLPIYNDMPLSFFQLMNMVHETKALAWHKIIISNQSFEWIG